MNTVKGFVVNLLRMATFGLVGLLPLDASAEEVRSVSESQTVSAQRVLDRAASIVEPEDRATEGGPALERYDVMESPAMRSYLAAWRHRAQRHR